MTFSLHEIYAKEKTEQQKMMRGVGENIFRQHKKAGEKAPDREKNESFHREAEKTANSPYPFTGKPKNWQILRHVSVQQCRRCEKEAFELY